MSTITSKGVANGVIQDDWDKIIEICEAGLASKFYSIGDFKPLALTEPEVCTVNMELVAFNAEYYQEGTHLVPASTSWLSKEAINKKASGVSTSSYLSDDFRVALPSNVKNALKSVQKYWAYPLDGNTDGYEAKVYEAYRSTYKVFSPCVRDFISTYGTRFSTPGSRIKKLVGTNTQVPYRLEDRISATETLGATNFYFAGISSVGKYTRSGSTSYLVFGFCI